MQKLSIIINDAPYGTEKTYNVLSMATTLQKEHYAILQKFFP